MSNRVHRASLSDSVTAALRAGIEAGRWRNELPGEVALCAELNVSRMTLRKAVEQLAREGWLKLGGRGRHHRILPERTAPSQTPAGRTIRVLTPYLMSGSVMQGALGTLANRVAAEGYRLEMECHPRLFESNRPSELRRLSLLPDTAGWLLLYTTESIQRWFAQSGLPSVICGRPYEGVGLSSVQPKPDGIARHAMGRFYAHGHRDLVCLIAEVTSLSDRLVVSAFQQEARKLGIHARVVQHDGSAASVSRAVDGILSTTPRPTGMMSNCPEHCVTALCRLLGRGVRVPDDMAIVCGWSDACLNYTVPAIAHYHIDGAKLGKKLGNVFLDLFEHGAGKIRSIDLIPEFVQGGSLSAIGGRVG